MLSPLHPREPRRHASHKARHQGGPGAKEDIDTKAKKGIRVYLERRGFEIPEEDWARGGDVADFIARDEDDLLFVHCQITQNGGEGFPEEDADRAALERLAAAYLAEHLDSEDIRIRFDVVSMLIVGESRALFRHHLNALGRPKRRAPPGASAPGGASSKGCLFCLPRNDDGNESRDYLLEVTLETGWVSDKSTWVVDEAEKPLASWMLSVLRNVDA